MRESRRHDEKVEDLVRREEVVERPGREALGDAVCAARRGESRVEMDVEKSDQGQRQHVDAPRPRGGGNYEIGSRVPRGGARPGTSIEMVWGRKYALP